MDQHRYVRTEESFRAFQQTQEKYTPEEVTRVTDTCDDVSTYANIAAVFLYAGGPRILEIEEGKTTRNGPFISKCRYFMPAYPLDILESDDLETLERAVFNHYVDNEYFR